MSVFTQLSEISRVVANTPVRGCTARMTEKRRGSIAKAWDAHSSAAIASYRAVMQGRGWITQAAIERSLGYAATSSTAFLAKLHGLGLVDRRNRNGSPVFSKRIGYEWRWVEGE